MNRSNNPTIQLIGILAVSVLISYSFSGLVRTLMEEKNRIFGFYFGPQTTEAFASGKPTTSPFLSPTQIYAQINKYKVNFPAVTVPKNMTKQVFYLEQDKLVSKKVLNNSDSLFYYTGHGSLKGLNVAVAGQMSESYGPNGMGPYKIPLRFQGQGVITASNGERASYAFQSIGYTANNGKTQQTGIIVFLTAPSTGKLAFLIVPSNMLGISTTDMFPNSTMTMSAWKL